MKQHLRMLSLLVISAAPLSAQTHFGAFIGGLSSNASVKPENFLPNKKARFGITAGLSLNLPLTTTLSFAPEVGYVEKGVKAEQTVGENKIEANVKISGIEIPLLLRFSPNTKGALKPFIIAGPSLTLAQKCHEIIKLSGEEEQETNQDCSEADESGSDDVVGSDFGLMFGVGVTNGKGSLTVRYDMGLKNIRKENNDHVEAKNRALMVVIGFTM